MTKDNQHELPHRLGYSITEFCKAVPVSRVGFYRMQRRGEAPAVCRIGKARVVIRRETAEQWLKDREEKPVALGGSIAE
jgi:predicted DNA-binding transcriptional regulator AlpA